MVSDIVVVQFLSCHFACRIAVLCLSVFTFNHDCVDSIIFMVNLLNVIFL